MYNSLLKEVFVDVVRTTNDLGIIFDRELNFHEYIEKSCYKALKILGFVKRVSMEFNLLSSLKSLFCALVRSILEYAMIIVGTLTP